MHDHDGRDPREPDHDPAPDARGQPGDTGPADREDAGEDDEEGGEDDAVPAGERDAPEDTGDGDERRQDGRGHGAVRGGHGRHPRIPGPRTRHRAGRGRPGDAPRLYHRHVSRTQAST